MFSLLVSVKILVTSLISLFKHKLFRKMIISIYLFLISAFWEHLKQVSVKYKYLYILDQIVTGLLVYHACYTAEVRRCELLNMHLKE